MNYHAGLYFVITLPNNTEAQALMRQRSQWHGVSIGWLHEDSITQMDWASSTNLVLRIGFVTNISICAGDRQPAYSNTWVAEYSEASVARVKRENDERLVGIWGSDYKRLPRELWSQPLQSTALESKLREKDPDRERWIVMPWGCGTLVREYRP
jgi:hypothetical protein